MIQTLAFPCYECKKQFNSFNKLRTHELFDHGHFVENCKIPKKSFNKKEYLKEYLKEYRRKNHSKILELHKQYYQKNKDRIKTYHKQYYRKNKGRILESYHIRKQLKQLINEESEK